MRARERLRPQEHLQQVLPAAGRRIAFSAGHAERVLQPFPEPQPHAGVLTQPAAVGDHPRHRPGDRGLSALLPRRDRLQRRHHPGANAELPPARLRRPARKRRLHRLPGRLVHRRPGERGEPAFACARRAIAAADTTAWSGRAWIRTADRPELRRPLSEVGAGRTQPGLARRLQIRVPLGQLDLRRGRGLGHAEPDRLRPGLDHSRRPGRRRLRDAAGQGRAVAGAVHRRSATDHIGRLPPTRSSASTSTLVPSRHGSRARTRSQG